MGKSENDSAGNQPLEDRVMKSAAMFMGEELLSLLGVEGKVKRAAPTEQVYLEVKDFLEDFNYEMEDGTWKHLEFESDSISEDDLRRFRAYEAVVGYHYKTAVSTYVLCSAQVSNLKSELAEGLNTYHVQVIRMKDRDGGQVIEALEQKLEAIEDTEGSEGCMCCKREELLEVLLTPLMGGNMPQLERIERSMKIIKRADGVLGREERSRMQSVLYALAIKFLREEELMKVKEVFSMTLLGQMLVNDGIEQGIEKGIKKGIEKGIKKGIEKGIEKGLVQLVCKKMRKGRALEVIAEELEEDISVIAPIYETAGRFSPEYDSDLVYEQIENSKYDAHYGADI